MINSDSFYKRLIKKTGLANFTIGIRIDNNFITGQVERVGGGR